MTKSSASLTEQFCNEKWYIAFAAREQCSASAYFANGTASICTYLYMCVCMCIQRLYPSSRCPSAVQIKFTVLWCCTLTRFWRVLLLLPVSARSHSSATRARARAHRLKTFLVNRFSWQREFCRAEEKSKDARGDSIARTNNQSRPMWFPHVTRGNIRDEIPFFRVNIANNNWASERVTQKFAFNSAVNFTTREWFVWFFIYL